MRRVRLWWSTGKDSAWALHVLRADPSARVEGLITTVTPEFGRVAVHGTRLEVLEAQAEAVGLPLETVELPWPCTNDDYEAAVAPAVTRAEADGITHMAFGDLFLADVRAYRERLLDESSVEPLFPLWGLETRVLAHEMIGAGLRARITALDPDRVDRGLAGEFFDPDRLEATSPEVDPCGENGEFHTVALDGPIFERPVEVEVGETVERSGLVYRDLSLSRPARARS